jgi:NADH-quinone oxidoreductase subunit N
MSMSDFIAVLPEVVLLVVACAILLVEAFVRPQGSDRGDQTERGLWTPSLIMAFVGLVASGVVSVWMLQGQSALAFDGTLASTEWAVFFDVLFATGAAITILMSPAYLRAHGRHLGEYYALVLFAVIGMDLMAAARDFVVFYVALELMAISSYLLAAFFRYRMRSNESSLKYFLTGSFASAVTLYGISLVYGLVGSTRYSQIFAASGAAAGIVSSSGLIFAAFLVAVGLAFKVSCGPPMCTKALPPP